VLLFSSCSVSLVFPAPATSAIYTLSLHDALPICGASAYLGPVSRARQTSPLAHPGARPLGHDCRLWLSWRGHRHVCVLLPHPLRSEEHTSELQSRFDLVCRLLLEKKKRIHRSLTT